MVKYMMELKKTKQYILSLIWNSTKQTPAFAKQTFYPGAVRGAKRVLASDNRNVKKYMK